MSRLDQTTPMTARIPADVDRPDRILFGLTGRQVAILTVAGLVLYGAWQALLPVVEPLVLLIASIPYAAAALAVATVRRDGIGLDAWLLAGWRHRRAPHRLVPVEPNQLTPAPAWVAGDRLPLPAPLRLPARGITAAGTIDLGPDGHVALLACSTVNFSLRSVGEQHALVGGLARFLHSLTGPVQILIQARPVSLVGHAQRILTQAAGLPDPALEQAARDHAAFCAQLATDRELLHRQVLVAVRDRRGPAAAAHRASEAARQLAGCEVTAHTLDADQAAATLAAACQPTAAGRPGEVGW